MIIRLIVPGTATATAGLLCCIALAWGIGAAEAQPTPNVQVDAQDDSSSATQSAGMAKLQEALAILDSASADAASMAAAERSLRAAIAADAEFEEAHYDLVVFLVRQGRIEDAKAALAAMQSSLPGTGSTVAAEGIIYEATGDLTQAESRYRKAMEIDRTAPQPNVYFAGKANRERSWDDAIRHSRLALVGDPGNVNAYLNLATAYYETKQLELAQLVCYNAVGLAPNSAPLYNMLGLVQLAKDDLRSALASFNQAIKSDSTHIEARLNAGALTLGYSDFGTALEHFDAVLVLNPQHRGAKLSRAVALRGLDRFDEAQAAYEAIIAEPGENFDARYNLCILHNEFTSEYQKALEVCDALRTDLPGDHPKKQEMESRVKGIRTTIEALQGG